MMQKILLCIIDGWGVAPASPYNTVSLAHTPTWDMLTTKYPMCTLSAAEESVGLPKGQMGNSEVGHMTMGMGRIVLQDLPRIGQAIKNGHLLSNKIFSSAIKRIKLHNAGVVHIIGICSDGGIHGHIDHILAMSDEIVNHNIKVKLHLILDGRDTLPFASINFINTVKKKIINHRGLMEIATICGRFYAMDRDNNDVRTQQAVELMLKGKGKITEDFIASVQSLHAQNITDEYITPHKLFGYRGIDSGDSIIITNFRADRVRQLAMQMIKQAKDFNIELFAKLTMTSYSSKLEEYYQTIFTKLENKQGLGEVLANHTLRQIRIAETEKYAHVTYFFNGGREQPFDGEKRVLVPSPKVDDIRKVPEMSSQLIVDAVIKALSSDKYNFILCNFAATDIVGHTGDLAATVKAVETIDVCLQQIYTKVKEHGVTLIVTSDHGNCEEMQDSKTLSVKTSHTTNKVPFIIVDKIGNHVLNNGTISDVAPTILKLMAIEQPYIMKGKSLIK